MTTWNTGKVVDFKQWNPALFSLSIDSELRPFQAGQFVKIGLEINGEVVARPYSLINPPQRRPLEIYCLEIPDGQLSPKLAKLQPGNPILVAPQAYGFMVLDEIPVARHLWMMATGTGIGPFISMLQGEQLWQRFERIVLAYGVRTFSALAYRDLIDRLCTEHPSQLCFVPFISRESYNFALHGRIPNALQDGRLESRTALELNAKDSQVLLCGNPQMITDTTKVLLERGLKKHRRSDPGQITSEHYW